jgi:hypothetical protein
VQGVAALLWATKRDALRALGHEQVLGILVEINIKTTRIPIIHDEF